MVCQMVDYYSYLGGLGFFPPQYFDTMLISFFFYLDKSNLLKYITV